MRKLLFIVTLASALFAAALATPASAAPASGAHASATAAVSGKLLAGSGTLGQFGDPTVLAHALSSASGIQGGFVITYPDGTYVAGSPACLFVSGNTAYLTGRIILSHGVRVQADNWSAGNYVVIGVQDNGAQVPDLLNFSPGFTSNPGCGPNGAATPGFPIARGNYRVFSLP
ncbi:MAG TPA: hypothetical protein VF070_27265 [Streptosporangiaceae bacterium]